MAGLATGRVWMGLVGLILGHQFDRGFAQRFASPEDGAASSYQVPDGYGRALIQTIGHVAKADGRVTEDEIRAARALMHRLGLGPAGIRAAVRWFETGKDRDYPLRPTLHALRRNEARRAEQRS